MLTFFYFVQNEIKLLFKKKRIMSQHKETFKTYDNSKNEARGADQKTSTDGKNGTVRSLKLNSIKVSSSTLSISSES